MEETEEEMIKKEKEEIKYLIKEIGKIWLNGKDITKT
jgi:hypothetical protein